MASFKLWCFLFDNSIGRAISFVLLSVFCTVDPEVRHCEIFLLSITTMAASKKLTKFLKKVLQISPVSQKPSFSRHSSATSNSFDSSSVEMNSGRSWGNMADFHSYDSDADSSCAPADVPSGCLAVYVGNERQRFVISTSYLTNSIFRALLAKSEEEFGFCCDGGLRIACNPGVFEHLLWWLQGATSEFVDDIEIAGHDDSSD